MLVVLFLLASMAHLNLSKHLLHELVLDIPKEWLKKSWPRISIETMDGDSIVLLNRMVVQNLSDVSLLNNVAIGALSLLNTMAIRVEGGPNLAEEADNLVAISALLGVDGDLLADDAGGLFNKLLLEVFVEAFRLDLEVDQLVVRERALADDLVDDPVRNNQVVPVPLGHR